MEDKRTNAGFEIIESIKLHNNTEYVLGFRISNYAEPEYVTWFYNHNAYYYGHYFMSERLARLDLIERAINTLSQIRDYEISK